jgi:ketosteroid isomerase-like protein
MIIAAACAPPAEETPPAEPAVDVAAEAAAIMQLERDWSAMFGAGDVDAIMNLHAADAVQFPDGMKAVVGQEALRASWEAFAAMEDLNISWEPTAAFVSPDGNMAYDYGTSLMETPDGAVPGKYLVVWVKVDGEWKVAADMFNSNVAPQ